MAGVQDLSGYALLFVVTGVLIAIGIYVVSSIQTQLGASSTATMNYSFSNATTGMATLASWLPIIAIVVAAAVVLSLVISAFTGGGRRG